MEKQDSLSRPHTDPSDDSPTTNYDCESMFTLRDRSVSAENLKSIWQRYDEKFPICWHCKDMIRKNAVTLECQHVLCDDCHSVYSSTGTESFLGIVLIRCPVCNYKPSVLKSCLPKKFTDKIIESLSHC